MSFPSLSAYIPGSAARMAAGPSGTRGVPRILLMVVTFESPRTMHLPVKRPVATHESSSASEAAARIGGVRLPGTRQILSWLYVGRVAVAASIFTAVVGIWSNVAPATSLAASLTLVVAGLVSAASFAYTHLAGRPATQNFLYGQAVFDTLLVTWVIYLTGGAGSAFSLLYVLIIAASSLLLAVPGGILIGGLSGTLYFSVVVYSGTTSAGTLLQVLLLSAVALATSALGDRLRRTGTELGKMETELRLLRLDTNDILQGIGTAIITVDGSGRLAYINPAATDLLGIGGDSWLGLPVLSLLDELAPGLGAVITRSAQNRKPIRRFETEPLRDGSLVLGVSTTLLERAPDQPPAVTAIFQDITERKRIDALRARTERLESIAELSASLAHEIKNPLAAIRSSAEQLGRGGIDNDDKRSLEGLIVRESDRLSRLLGDFLEFARVETIGSQLIRLPPLLEQVVGLAKAHPDAAGRGVETQINAPRSQLVVRGDEDLLHRAMLNLLMDGLQWAGGGGRVQIGLDVVDSDVLSPAEGSARVIRISVRDSGPGVDAGVSEQIFDPFFPRRSGGTGLGLALVQRAADAHGGAVYVEDPVPGEDWGATFIFYLPAEVPPFAADPGEANPLKEMLA
ncbi:MAG: two-component system sensor histidine kinase NtrB [Solirubrobacterales bacterium]